MPSDKRQRQREGRQARQEELRRAQQRARKRRQAILGGVFVVVALGIFYLVTKNSGSAKKVTTKGPTTTGPAQSTTTVPGATTTTAATIPPVSVVAADAPPGVDCPKADGSSPRYTKFVAAPPMCIDAAKTYTATMQTDAGDIIITLDPAAAKATVNNFVFLSEYHFYDGIAFHRVIPDFVDQGGDPTGTGNGGPGYQFADELPKTAAYKAGSLAMANSGPNTNGSQFFIVVSDTGGQQLTASYSLFGQVTGGMDVVKKINDDGTSAGTPKVVHKIVKVTIAVS